MTLRRTLTQVSEEAEHGRKLGGRKPKPPDPDALAKRRINTTDPDTRLLTRAGRRAVQGYNAQVVASPEQVIVAADLSQQSNDSGQLAPMVEQASEALREAGVSEPIGTVLADGGYWNSPQIAEVRGEGIDVIVPIENKRRRRRVEADCRHPQPPKTLAGRACGRQDGASGPGGRLRRTGGPLFRARSSPKPFASDGRRRTRLPRSFARQPPKRGFFV